MINIYILNYNNLQILKICINSLLSRTRYPHRLIIIDNNSTDKDLFAYYNFLQKTKKVDIYRNNNNLWILGLNPAMKKYEDGRGEYFVVTDPDIVVPGIKNGECWLEKLVIEMNINPVIGKLGVGLDLGYIKSRSSFNDTYFREFNYYLNPKIGQNFIAGVDTTLAIYRHDFFMHDNPRFYPGHAMMNRPHYYTCRTEINFTCKHIGWRIYSNKDLLSMDDRKSKVICMTLMGGFLDPVFINYLPYFYRVIYKIFRPLARTVWAINTLACQFLWLLKSAPSKLNILQYSAKKIGK